MISGIIILIYELRIMNYELREKLSEIKEWFRENQKNILLTFLNYYRRHFKFRTRLSGKPRIHPRPDCN